MRKFQRISSLGFDEAFTESVVHVFVFRESRNHVVPRTKGATEIGHKLE
jgi:hypothetical protein